MYSKAIDIRKSVFLALSTVAMAIVFLTVSVSATTDTISVKGGSPGYNPPTGSIVIVKCGNQTKNPTTDNKGRFNTVFNKTSDCTKGTIITGTFEDYYGTSKVNNSYKTDTLQLRKTEAVPEIGTIASIAALAVTGGAIVYVRRRQMQAPIA